MDVLLHLHRSGGSLDPGRSRGRYPVRDRSHRDPDLHRAPRLGEQLDELVPGAERLPEPQPHRQRRAPGSRRPRPPKCRTTNAGGACGPADKVTVCRSRRIRAGSSPPCPRLPAASPDGSSEMSTSSPRATRRSRFLGLQTATLLGYQTTFREASDQPPPCEGCSVMRAAIPHRMLAGLFIAPLLIGCGDSAR